MHHQDVTLTDVTPAGAPTANALQLLATATLALSQRATGRAIALVVDQRSTPAGPSDQARNAGMDDIPARLLWLNGAHYVGKRTLAARLRDQWGATVFDAEAVGVTLQKGLPAALDPGDLQRHGIWLWTSWRLGIHMARTYTLTVLPAGLHQPAAVTELVSRYREADVDVLHVVLDADLADLRARIHGNHVDRDAKRWALEHLRPAFDGLAEVHDGVRLDTTGKAPDQIAADLQHALVRHGWLAPDGTWTATPPPAHPPSSSHPAPGARHVTPAKPDLRSPAPRTRAAAPHGPGR